MSPSPRREYMLLADLWKAIAILVNFFNPPIIKFVEIVLCHYTPRLQGLVVLPLYSVVPHELSLASSPRA